jgi:hypothetical protein
MTEIYVTSVSGQLVAEINGKRYYELTDCIYDMGWSFGETHEVDFDMTDDEDVWALIDAIYEHGDEE